MIRRIVGRLEEGVISLLLVAMTMLVFVEVVLRFGFNTGALWIQELTLHLSTWFVLFGVSYGVKTGAHIGVDAVVKLLKPRGRRIVGLIAVALCLVYCGIFLFASVEYILKIFQIGIEMEDLPIPRWLAQSILVAAFILLPIRFMEAGWGLLTGKLDGLRLADEARAALSDTRLKGGAS